ncbi:MAG TPA: transaldolase family protein [Opitutus sp.]|nr:transaldolase family protein [Opitutus sp.]
MMDTDPLNSHPMRLWLATTNPAFVAASVDLGLFDGVLTNPTLLATVHRPPREVILDLCAASSLPVFYQLKHDSVEAMKREATSLLELGIQNLGIKVAVTRSGWTILNWLSAEKVALRLATCVPTVTQVLLAAALDVPWITPSGSLLEKLGGSSKLALIAEMQAVLERQGSETRLIPSLASTAELQAFAQVGVRNGFVWEKDVARFVDSELVESTVRSFDSAWAQLDRASVSQIRPS